MELDTHADTCALGDGALILGSTGETINVGGFGEDIGTLKDVPIVHGAVAYDCPTTHETYILIYHQALSIPTMETHLLNPFQMREQGITVNDVPLQQLEEAERDSKAHSIISHDPSLHIPLDIKGTMSGFLVRKPTWEEVADPNKATHIHMTSDIEWKPNSKTFAAVEQALRDDINRNIVLGRDLRSIQARGQ